VASSYNTVSVGSTATLILAANLERRGSLLFNNSNQTVYLGMDVGVTTSNGFPLLSNASMQNSGPNAVWKGVIYGIVSSSTADCRFWEWVQ
jgi:hypothetical protein